MSAPVRVAVIGGGATPEHEVSLASAAAAHAALDRSRYAPVQFTIGPDGSWVVAGVPTPMEWAVRELRGCDVALPLVHGAPGEDGALAGLCELVGIPYVGSGVGAGGMAMDKATAKAVAAGAGVSVADGFVVRTGDTPGWCGEVVVKPLAAGSSRGVTLVSAPEQWLGALENARRFGDRVLVETVQRGREIDIGVLELPGGERMLGAPLEIAAGGVFGYDAKYGSDPGFVIPAPLEPRRLDQLERDALTVFDALGCRGFARVDFFLTAEGWVFNEINTCPGMTAHSQFPKMFAARGIDYPRLLDLLIERALERRVTP